MMRFRFGSFVAGLSLIAATSAGAQSTVVLTQPYAPGGGAVTAFGYYMSPYSGTVDGTTQRLNCVDFFHEVSLGEVWTATVTNLGAAIGNISLLANTRDGSSGGYATLSDVLKIYMEAAWLTNQFAANPASNPNQSIAIQTAIWSIVDNGPTSPASLQYANTGDYWNNGQTSSIVNSGSGSTGYWIQRAQTEYATQAAGYYNQFNILTGTGNPGSSAQEFIYSTPEPGTFILIGSGLMGLVGFVRTRRRKGDSTTLLPDAVVS
jgi:hypothetical protein